MFDAITYKNESKVVAVTKEIEKTISPDKVVEMYDAVKKELEDNVLKRIRVDNNFVKAVIEFRQEQATGNKLLFIAFNINGKNYKHEEILPDFSMIDDIDKTILHLVEVYSKFLVYQALEENITTEVLKQIKH